MRATREHTTGKNGTSTHILSMDCIIWRTIVAIRLMGGRMDSAVRVPLLCESIVGTCFVMKPWSFQTRIKVCGKPLVLELSFGREITFSTCESTFSINSSQRNSIFTPACHRASHHAITAMDRPEPKGDAPVPNVSNLRVNEGQWPQMHL
jgi:hypothetical protein